MSSRHAGKVAIVTGGGSGYGRGIAAKLASEGASVVIADISSTNGTQAAAELNATFVHADITKRADWQSILDTTLSNYATIDIIVNNAGACYDKTPSETVEESVFDLLMDVNVKSIFHSTSIIIPYLLAEKKGGVFISTASTSAVRPRAGLAWYAASKAAVNTASNALAVEFASRGIRFNTVCPVVGLTNMTNHFLATETNLQAFTSVIPMGRMCTPRDVANAVSYLASDEADFITGVNFPVDGGRCV